jgi:hypothetical protein
MAIVIEEEGNKTNIVGTVTWVVVLVIIVLTIYYVFFAQPQLVEVVAPANFKNIDPLANVTLNLEDVTGNRNFQNLKQYITPISPGNYGRSNPFLPL